jgi:hypothetical protein
MGPAAGAPQAEPGLPGTVLGLVETRAVGDVGRVVAGVRVPVVDLGGVHEQAVGPVYVGQQPVVAVAGLDVAGEPDLGARGHEGGQVGGGLVAEALDRAAGGHRLGRVDADQPDRLGRAGQLDHQRVAVDGPDDRAGAWRSVRARARRGGPGQVREGERGHRRGGGREGARCRGHPSLRG